MSEEPPFKSMAGIMSGVVHTIGYSFLRESPIKGHPGSGIDILVAGRGRMRSGSDEAWQGVVTSYEKGQALCESPIERNILAGMLTSRWEPFHLRNPVVALPDEDLPGEDIVIVPQFKVHRYRLDFAVFARFKERLSLVCVECDGKAFHDPSKDAVRDRDLAAIGIRTIRVSGQAALRNPITISDQVADAVWRIAFSGPTI